MSFNCSSSSSSSARKLQDNYDGFNGVISLGIHFFLGVGGTDSGEQGTSPPVLHGTATVWRCHAKISGWVKIVQLMKDMPKVTLTLASFVKLNGAVSKHWNASNQQLSYYAATCTCSVLFTDMLLQSCSSKTNKNARQKSGICTMQCTRQIISTGR